MPPEETSDDSLSVERANEVFYEALSHLSHEEMDRVWSHGNEVRCIHPGWDVLIGWSAVREAWRSIFASSPGLAVAATEVEVNVFGDLAWVLCMERILNADEGSESVSFARATNLFARTPEGWKMILHHASPVPNHAGVVASDQVH